MKNRIFLIGLALLTISCSGELEEGRRYRAERDLSQANREFETLRIRPQDVAPETWQAMADRFEDIAERYKSPTKETSNRDLTNEIQAISARASFTAAQVYSALGDSGRVSEIYQQMAMDFGHLDQVFGEIALARGQLAERGGEFGKAIELYQSIIDRVPPEITEANVAGIVMGLPLRIAKLRLKETGGSDPKDCYADAKAYYEGVVRDYPGERLQVEAQSKLTEVASELEDWDHAIELLETLEAQLLEMEDPPRHPSEVRFSIAGIQTRAEMDPALTRDCLLSILEEYPDCEIKANVLSAIAINAVKREQAEEAIAYFDRIIEEHADDEDAAPEAMLQRGRVLGARTFWAKDRWPEALDQFRAISIQYPITQAALKAPLEIAKHYAVAGDSVASLAALDKAERDYRSFITRYPPGPIVYFARERLIQALSLMRNFDDAVSEMVRLGDDLAGTPRGASHLVAAARMAFIELEDTTRASTILVHTSEVYQTQRVGQWAAAEADRIRGSNR